VSTNREPRSRWTGWSVGVILAVTAILPAGCGGGTARIPPPLDPASARQALETALARWQEGEEPAALRTATPAIQVADEQWLFGGKLHEFTILDEGSAEGTQVRFRVRLRAADQGRIAPVSREVAYLVIPGSTLSIIRDDS
jgi:hypothetical protein